MQWTHLVGVVDSNKRHDKKISFRVTTWRQVSSTWLHSMLITPKRMLNLNLSMGWGRTLLDTYEVSLGRVKVK